MRIPLSWLREYVDIPSVSPRDVAERLVDAGLEVERVQPVGHEIKNLVVGEVLDIEELTGLKRPMRYCRVEVGEGQPRGIICGATNFDPGARVPVALPGAVLPGGFEIGARKAYGRMSEGMICSASELGIGADHTGIIVLDDDPPVGADAVELLELRDDVLDIDVLPDRSYCLSIRGVAREVATVYGVPFRDPAEVPLPPAPEGSYPARIADPTACDRFVLRSVTGFDPARRTPLWMQRRLTLAGLRPVSLAVDITNYLMIELGQPIHAFDRTKLQGEIVVRRAEPGERLETLDHVVRDLDRDDILITDSSGPISLAGTMGGVSTEIDGASTDMVIEAAHFSAAGTARMSRRHRLSSEASYRFERGVDRELPLYASAKAVRMLAELGGATVLPGCTHAEVDQPRPTITIPADHPDRVAGITYGREAVVRRLRDVGCTVDEGAGGGDMLTVTAPTWRPDLRDPNDLAEEVIRLEGYGNLPSVPPQAPAGRGLTPGQRLRRRVGQALAAAGYVEVLTYPFVSERDWDRLHLPADDARRRALAVANPLSEDEPLLRTTLLPGLLRALLRNVGRGLPDVSLYEMGLVYRPHHDAPPAPSRLPVDRAPTPEEVAALDAALPDQPHRVGVVLAGNREPAGWWGKGRPANWADAVEAAREVARAAGVELAVRADHHAPWHPGRCAALLVEDQVVGHAGELHPRVIHAYELPARTCAMELDLSRVEAAAPGPVEAPRMSTYPVATLDVALTVTDDVPAAAVEEALRQGAGELLEAIRLFDIYTGAQVGEGRKSLAYALRFRALDRTLTTEETTAARDAAVTEAARRTGAEFRGG